MTDTPKTQTPVFLVTAEELDDEIKDWGVDPEKLTAAQRRAIYESFEHALAEYYCQLLNDGEMDDILTQELGDARPQYEITGPPDDRG